MHAERLFGTTVVASEKTLKLGRSCQYSELQPSTSDMSCLIAKSQSTWTKRTSLTPLPTAQTLSRPLFTTQPLFTESIKNNS